jgi:hypothetical protein
MTVHAENMGRVPKPFSHMTGIADDIQFQDMADLGWMSELGLGCVASAASCVTDPFRSAMNKGSSVLIIGTASI